MAARRKAQAPVLDVATPPAPAMPHGWFIVNPHGTIHAVNEDDFHILIKRPGWRAATAADLERLNRHGGKQPLPKE